MTKQFRSIACRINSEGLLEVYQNHGILYEYDVNQVRAVTSTELSLMDDLDFFAITDGEKVSKYVLKELKAGVKILSFSNGGWQEVYFNLEDSVISSMIVSYSDGTIRSNQNLTSFILNKDSSLNEFLRISRLI